MTKPRRTWICSSCGTEFNNRSHLPPRSWRWNGDALTCGDCSTMPRELPAAPAQPETERRAA